jgi:rhodanese-related sulfurtransferase
VKDHASQSGTPGRRPAAGRILAEALLVAAIGAAFAFAANQISPLGLALTRDYFPSGTNHVVRPVTGARLQEAAGTNSAALSPAQFLAAQMKERGLQLIDGSRAVQLFHDPRRQQDVIVFIDARDEAHYQQGHIPGACEFDPYHKENYIATAQPLCMQAEQVVIYCNGGDCDDSVNAALQLREIGVPNQKLFIYAGGFTEWTTNNLPVETGARNSGTLLNTNALINTNK